MHLPSFTTSRTPTNASRSSASRSAKDSGEKRTRDQQEEAGSGSEEENEPDSHNEKYSPDTDESDSSSDQESSEEEVEARQRKSQKRSKAARQPADDDAYHENEAITPGNLSAKARYNAKRREERKEVRAIGANPKHSNCYKDYEMDAAYKRTTKVTEWEPHQQEFAQKISVSMHIRVYYEDCAHLCW